MYTGFKGLTEKRKGILTLFAYYLQLHLFIFTCNLDGVLQDIFSLTLQRNLTS